MPLALRSRRTLTSRSSPASMFLASATVLPRSGWSTNSSHVARTGALQAEPPVRSGSHGPICRSTPARPPAHVREHHRTRRGRSVSVEGPTLHGRALRDLERQVPEIPLGDRDRQRDGGDAPADRDQFVGTRQEAHGSRKPPPLSVTASARQREPSGPRPATSCRRTWTPAPPPRRACARNPPGPGQRPGAPRPRRCSTPLPRPGPPPRARRDRPWPPTGCIHPARDPPARTRRRLRLSVSAVDSLPSQVHSRRTSAPCTGVAVRT